MKGAFSDNERLYAQHLQNKLYPDHTYSVIEEEALSKFERIDPNTEVPSQPQWGSPREDHVTCSPDALAPDPSKQNTLCVSYLLGDITNTFEGFTLSLLSSLMISGPNSPFYKALIEPKLGTDFSSVVGYDGSTKEASFSIGLQGMAEEDTERIEIQMKHQSTNFGLSLASYIASSWNHDGDPVQLLQISDSVAKFRQALAENPRFLQDKVRHYFRENTHRLTLSMSPDDSYLEKQAQAEEEKLQKKIQVLSDSDKKEIYEKGGVPVQYCEQPTNGLVYFRAMCSLNTLPEDLRLYVPLFCSVITRMGSGGLDYRQQAQQMDLRTGGMSVSTQVIPDSTHLDMYEQGVLLMSSCLERNLPHMFQLWSDIFNSPHFDDEERLRVLVMSSAQELANGISYSGHMYAMTRAGRHLSPAGDLQESFNGMEQVKFMKRIAEMPDLSQVIRTLPRIKKHLLNPDNMRCAVNATPQAVSDTAAQLDTFMRDVAENKRERKPVRPNITETDPPVVLFTLRLVRSARADDVTVSPQELNFQPCQMKTFFQMPFPINFVSETIRTVPFSHQDHASLCILARMMTAKFLHGEIREKGGAYGGGARMGGGGLFSFYSYRDPNAVQTLSAFRKGVDWAKSGQFTQQDIDEAKLSVFSAVDSPVAPAHKGEETSFTVVPERRSEDVRRRHPRPRERSDQERSLMDSVTGLCFGVKLVSGGSAVVQMADDVLVSLGRSRATCSSWPESDTS
ncbi:hypothetical protein INR49_000968 [Caranx melampygus]|nr:hypothetical protein INR49_000968 [Caranx melampygus]